MTLNFAIWWFVRPSQLLALVSALGLLAWLLGWRRTSRWLLGIGGGGLVLAGLTPLGFWMLGPLENRFPVPADPGVVDGIVILGGSEIVELSAIYGFPQLNHMGDRYLTTLLLAARYPTARVLDSGGGGRGFGSWGVSGESEVAGAILRGAGLDSDRLVFEDRSRNTCENAAFAKGRAQPREGELWLLVTSAFHMWRAHACFRANNWEVIPYPTDFMRSPKLHFGLSLFSFSDNLAVLDLAAHEWIGLLYYRMLVRIDSF